MYTPLGLSGFFDPPPVAEIPVTADYTFLLSLIILALGMLIGCSLGYMLFRRFL